MERYVQRNNLFLASLMPGTFLALGNSKGKHDIYIYHEYRNETQDEL